MLTFLKKLSPSFIKTLARNIRSFLYHLFDRFTPYLTNRTYCGFILYYTRGSGLVERIRFGNLNRVYEHDLIDALTTELSKHNSPVFLDIGTNIGLISLAIKKNIPAVSIFGFEPGPTAYKSFATSIFANQLDTDIHLYNEALHKETGNITFYTHNDTDCSGDGMIDTQRANSKATSIQVKANTLDAWFTENNIPKVHVVKIDIEGAELYALQGASKFLEEYKPIIYLEISVENLKVYPYTEKEILDFFITHNYSLFDMHSNKQCTLENISTVVLEHDTFIAKPNTN